MATDETAPLDGSIEAPDERLGPAGPAVSDTERKLSDRDQTQSDRDQALSDRDQQASDDDQAATEDGGETPAATHARTTAERADTARERAVTGGLRDKVADERDQAAYLRDQLAMQRDEVAARADMEALELSGRDTLLDRHTLSTQELRAHAAAGRLRATTDRRRAAQHRKQAALEREQAARDREQAARDRQQAATDELTGARRRGVGLSELEHEIDRARRTHARLVAAYVDVDDLKSLNDREGHHAGDQRIRDVADALRDHMRSYDLLVRLGGDEFLCILPDITLPRARERFEQVSSEMSDGASFSFGLSELADGETPQELIDRADSDLLASRTR